MTNVSYRRVAVAIDGSPAANAAINVALKLIEPDGEIGFLHAVDRNAAIRTFVPGSSESLSAAEFIDDFEADLFRHARSQAAARGVRTTVARAEGIAERAISAFAGQFGADIVVMGTHSDHGIARCALGSTAQSVVRFSHVPTIVTSESAGSVLDHGMKTVLVAIDASMPAAEAIGCGIALARRNCASILFVNVAEREGRRRTSAHIIALAACKYAASAGLEAEAFVSHGSPADAVCAAAEARGADILIIGTHGRTGAARRRTASVAEAVLRKAPCPVMVVPDARSGIRAVA